MAATLYFDGLTAGVNFIWNNTARWYTNAGLTVPNGAIPLAGDSVHIYGVMTAGPTVAITLNTVNVVGGASVSYGVNINSVTASQFTFNLMCQISGTFNGPSEFKNSSINLGLANGNVTFNLGTWQHGAYNGTLTVVGGSAVCQGPVNVVDWGAGPDFKVLSIVSQIVGSSFVF